MILFQSGLLFQLMKKSEMNGYAELTDTTSAQEKVSCCSFESISFDEVFNNLLLSQKVGALSM